MKIFLLGATGRVGQEVLLQSLNAGYTVTALVRNPTKIGIENTKLHIIKGDALDEHAIKNGMAESDVVVSVLGHSTKSANDLLKRSAQSVVKYLKPNQKFIALTGYGVRFDKDPDFTVSGKLLDYVIKAVPTDLWNDGNSLGEILKKSNKSWMLVRAPRIAKGKLTGNYRTGYLPVTILNKISTADVADFIVKNMKSNEWNGEAPIVQY